MDKKTIMFSLAASIIIAFTPLAQAQQQQATTQPPPGDAAAGAQSAGDDDVVDAEFEDTNK